jgi:RNA polymerase sigma factor (sigma-70 family)
MPSRVSQEGRAPPESAFATTHWSIVLAAGEKAGETARAALSTLCERYWYPLYAYVRRHGCQPDDAADLTQAFFARLIEKNVVAHADPQRGRFRTYLLASLKHFLANEWDREKALKRGGGLKPISLDVARAEDSYRLASARIATPEELFERYWALTLLECVLQDLRAQYTREGKAQLFDRLKGFLTGAAPDASYAQAGAVMSMSEGAVKVATHRLRKRYRNLLRQHISQTVATENEIDQEIRELFVALDV